MSSFTSRTLSSTREDLAVGAVGFDVDVERDHRAAFHVHLVDHVANLFEHPLVRHHHLLAERAAHLEQAERRGQRLAMACSAGGSRAAVRWLKGGKHEELPRGEKAGASHLRWTTCSTGSGMDSLPPGVFGKLPGLDQFALGVFDLDRNRVDADQFLDVLAGLGEALEADGVAFHQELKNHVLDELRDDVQPPGGLQGLLA